MHTLSLATRRVSFRRLTTGLLLGAAVTLIAACGGGGGGGGGGDGGAVTPTPTPTPTPVAPAITTQPQAVSVTAGQTATFSVSASGDAPLSYQWRLGAAAIAGATSAAYTTAATTLADSGASYSVVVGNGAGSVTSAGALLIVTAAPGGGGGGGGGTPAASTRYVESWSSADATAATGGLSLGVVDPEAPGAPSVVDQLPGVGGSLSSAPHGPLNTVLRIYGGSHDAATGRVSGHGLAHLVYVKNGAVYKLNLAKGNGVPVPVRLSTEASAGTLQLCGQNFSGSDALICIYPTTISSVRFVRLSTAADAAPISTRPGYAGDTFNGSLYQGNLMTWVNDPATGDIAGYLWQGLNGRLFRTDSAFANATNVFMPTTAAVPVGVGVGSGLFGAGRMARGYLFSADGALRRYDYASQSVHTAFEGLTANPTWALADAEHFYVRAVTSAGAQLVKLRDASAAVGEVLASGAVVDANLMFRLLDDYVVFTSGTQPMSAVRKSDGRLSTSALPTGALITGWERQYAYRHSGNRVYYSGVDVARGNVIGSVLADGTDRKEFNGVFTTVNAIAAELPAHLLATASLHEPHVRTLVKAGTGLAWLDLGTGVADVVVGPVVAGDYFGAPYTTMSLMLGSQGTAGLAAYATLADDRRIEKLDSYFIGATAGSLRRLTNHITP